MKNVAQESATKPTKVCRDCGVPKDINCFVPSEWKRKYPACSTCVRKNREQRRGGPDYHGEAWRGTVLVSKNAMQSNTGWEERGGDRC